MTGNFNCKENYCEKYYLSQDSNLEPPSFCQECRIPIRSPRHVVIFIVITFSILLSHRESFVMMKKFVFEILIEIGLECSKMSRNHIIRKCPEVCVSYAA